MYISHFIFIQIVGKRVSFQYCDFNVFWETKYEKKNNFPNTYEGNLHHFLQCSSKNCTTSVCPPNSASSIGVLPRNP